MREILFRGKSKYDNKWVYGFYSPIIWYPTLKQTSSIKNLKGSDIEIYINTLGQSTGLEDKNGTKIFEGDIIKDENGTLYTIEFEKGLFVAMGVNNNYEFLNHFKEITVIGNKYDDNKLIEV